MLCNFNFDFILYHKLLLCFIQLEMHAPLTCALNSTYLLTRFGQLCTKSPVPDKTPVWWHNYSKKVSINILFIKSNKLQIARKIHDECTEQMNDSTTEDIKSTRCQTT